MDANATVSINDKEVAISTLPDTSIVALLQRGINHVLGNEVASRVSTAKKATNEDGSLKYDETALEQLETETFAAKIKAIMEGTLGVRVAGVSRDPLAKYKREFAVVLLKAQYAKKSLKWPVGKGSGEVIAEMVGKVLNHAVYGPKATEYANEQVAKAQAMAGDIGDLLDAPAAEATPA